MENSNRNILITCVILLSVICICLCLTAAGSVLVWAISSTTETTANIPLNPTNIPTSTPTRTVKNINPTPESELSKISPFVAAQMDQIEMDVSEIRGLTANQPVSRTLLTPEELQQRVIDDFLADYAPEDAQKDSIVLAAFGLLEPGYDLQALYIDLLSEQIAGFYDDEDKTMYVIQEESFGGTQRMTYAHEFVHALQDQTYDLRNGLDFNDDSCEANSERCAAVQALIEGDASLAELSWFTDYSTTEDRNQILEFYSNYESPVFDSTPGFLQRDFLFPYQEGMTFVQSLFDTGGWEAVDSAYRETPVSTEQILHPEKYPTDQPIDITVPSFQDVLGSGWEELDHGVMGEWYTYLILAYGDDPDGRLPDDQAKVAASGWDGDFYVVYHNDQDNSTTMILTYLWESQADATEFSDAFQTFANGRFGNGEVDGSNFISWQTSEGIHEFQTDGTKTTWILAPDKDTANKIWDVLNH